MLNAFSRTSDASHGLNLQFRQFIHSSGCQLARSSARPRARSPPPPPPPESASTSRRDNGRQLPTSRRRLDDFSSSSRMAKNVILPPNSYGLREDFALRKAREASSRPPKKEKRYEDSDPILSSYLSAQQASQLPQSTKQPSLRPSKTPSLDGLAVRAYGERLERRSSQPDRRADTFSPPPPLPKLRDNAPLPTHFTSPPLAPSLLNGLQSSEALGPRARPTPIQALSLAHVLPKMGDSEKRFQWVLASETGSGKSLAYLLPMLQQLKITAAHSGATLGRRRNPATLSPRGLVLAPTHELARQLKVMAKSLIHKEGAELRIQCASEPNKPTKEGIGLGRGVTARQMKDMELEHLTRGSVLGGRGIERPVDILTATPMKVLDMLFGRGWERRFDLNSPANDAEVKLPSWNKHEDLDLGNLEWLAVDEADVLFDSDFLRYTQLILAAAKTRVLESSTPYTSSPLPYHLTLSTATLPQSLTSYLSSSPSHKNIQILSSPHLHKLPQRLKMEHIDPPSGGLNSSILKKLREIWEAKSDAQVVVFCNRNTKVEELNGWLKGKGVECVAFGPGLAGGREFGSNRSLKAFLSPVATAQRFIASAAAATGDNEIMESSVADSTAGSPTPPAAISLKASPSTTPIPKVLITTSLLSRGLDFSQNVGHVFLIQPPRNQIDFLHRAGRTGRAGRKGTVVVFGDRTGGRGVGMKEMRALKGTVLKVKEQAKEGLKWSGEKRVSFGDSRSERRVH